MATQTVRHQQSEQTISIGGRTLDDLRLTEEQQEYLEKQFQKSKNPHPSELMLISAECGLSEDQVKIWYAHRMAKWRIEQGLNPISTRLC